MLTLTTKSFSCSEQLKPEIEVPSCPSINYFDVLNDFKKSKRRFNSISNNRTDITTASCNNLNISNAFYFTPIDEKIHE